MIAGTFEFLKHCMLLAKRYCAVDSSVVSKLLQTLHAGQHGLYVTGHTTAEGFQSDYSTPLIRISMYHRYTPAIPETVDEIRWLI